MSTPRRHLVRSADHATAGEYGFTYQHPLNPRADVVGLALSRMTGLARAAVNLFRVPPGKDSFAYHAHAGEEEWVYVLSGRAIAEIDGAEHEVGPGDFMGFATPQVGHHLRNPFDEELVYLSGGEVVPVDIVDFPRQGKRMLRVGETQSMVDLDAVQDYPGAPPLPVPR